MMILLMNYYNALTRVSLRSANFVRAFGQEFRGESSKNITCGTRERSELSEAKRATRVILFKILKTIKPNIIDAYSYSEENPPPHKNYKYTDKLYLGCILYIIKYNIGWESFLGPIPGSRLYRAQRARYNLDARK